MQIMSNHTPGLWSISNDAVPDGIVQNTIYSESTGSRIATVFQTEDNSLLIAAAPLLLACLVQCMDELAYYALDDMKVWDTATQDVFQECREAVAAAGGSFDA